MNCSIYASFLLFDCRYTENGVPAKAGGHPPEWYVRSG